MRRAFVGDRLFDQINASRIFDIATACGWFARQPSSSLRRVCQVRINGEA